MDVNFSKEEREHTERYGSAKHGVEVKQLYMLLETEEELDFYVDKHTRRLAQEFIFKCIIENKQLVNITMQVVSDHSSYNNIDLTRNFIDLCSFELPHGHFFFNNGHRGDQSCYVYFQKNAKIICPSLRNLVSRNNNIVQKRETKQYFNKRNTKWVRDMLDEIPWLMLFYCFDRKHLYWAF